MTDAATSSPVRRALDAQEDELRIFRRAQEAILEQIRVSDGHVATGIVDQVADSHDLPVQTVQRALWSLSSQGRLVVDDELIIRESVSA